MKKIHALSLVVTKLAAAALVLMLLVFVPVSSQAETVIYEGNNATGIDDLDVNNVLYDITFVFDTGINVHGDPGEFPFESNTSNTEETSLAAAIAIREALNSADEIIGTWNNGIWYWDVVSAAWTQLSFDTTNDDIAGGDFTGDGIADVAAIFQISLVSTPLGSGLYYLNGVSKALTKLPDSSPPPFSVTAGDVTGN